jgi:CBS-domain-containing membrane protein
MSQPVITCPDDATVDRAAQLMWEHDCGMIPIVNPEGRLAGVITDRDICMAAYTQGRPLCEIPVAAAMAKDVMAAYADDPVENAEALMAHGQVHRLPVLDKNNWLVGVISLNDLARLAARVRKNGIDREFVQAMAAVCEPRPHALTVVPQVGDEHPVLVGA